MTDVLELVERVSSWLSQPAEVVDAQLSDRQRQEVLDGVEYLNIRAAGGDELAFHQQQLLLSRIYNLDLQLNFDAATAEGSVLIHEITRLIEAATAAVEDAQLAPEILEQMPADPAAYVSWLKNLARGHRVFKHPYYTDFIRNEANSDDIRQYMIQESVIDGRFDDLLALMQIGTSGPAKLEIAANFWDEMGNGRPLEVHTELFKKIFEVFEIQPGELESCLTATALLSGNLAAMLCRYRSRYAEAVGYLGMTEWLVPDRFVNVVHAWERLGLPEVGIVYHRLHITVDSQHAAGWFHNVIKPAAGSSAMRLGIARGTLWRLNSSARYLDERLAETVQRRPEIALSS